MRPDGTPPVARWTTDDLAAPSERAAAWLIDAGIFWVVWVAGMILLIETGELGGRPSLASPRALLWLVIVWVLWRCYDALSVATWGSTAGRRVLDIEVRDGAGGRPTPGRAALRSCARTAGALPAGAGLLPLWSDPRRQAFHDRLAATMVVRSEALEPVEDGPGGMVAEHGSAELRGSWFHETRGGPAPPITQQWVDRLGRKGTVTDPAGVDTAEAAIRAARTGPAEAAWLRAVADQTAPRLDVAAPSWRRGEDPDGTAQRAFCLLLAALAERYPGHREVLVGVLDHHAALDDLGTGRMAHLAELLRDHRAARRWLRLPQTANMHVLLDEPATSRAAGSDDGQSGARART